jgi:hypothetical protein
MTLFLSIQSKYVKQHKYTIEYLSKYINTAIAREDYINISGRLWISSERSGRNQG